MYLNCTIEIRANTDTVHFNLSEFCTDSLYASTRDSFVQFLLLKKLFTLPLKCIAPQSHHSFVRLEITTAFPKEEYTTECSRAQCNRSLSLFDILSEIPRQVKAEASPDFRRETRTLSPFNLLASFLNKP